MMAARDREKEKEIRTRMLGIYNKQRDEFASLLEYNNYLEEVEELIFRFVRGTATDVDKDNHERYKRENDALIKENSQRLDRQRHELEMIIESDRKEKQRRIQQRQQEIRDKQQALIEAKEVELNKLAAGQDITTINLVIPATTETQQKLAATKMEAATALSRTLQLPRPRMTEEEIASKKSSLSTGPTILAEAHRLVFEQRIVEACADSIFFGL